MGGLTRAGSTEKPGDIKHVPTSAAPYGWLKANGAAVSRTAYPALFAAIATTFGVGDGATTFNLPDFRGEFLRGFDDGRGVDTGRVFGSDQAGQMQSHTHTANGENGVSSYGQLTGDVATGGNGAGTVTTSAAGGATNGGENRPRNVAVLICIKY